MEELNKLLIEYEELKKQNLNINMKRGTPSKQQLDLSMDMLDVLNSEADFYDEKGNDVRSYGILTGLEECKKMMGDMMSVSKDKVIIFGNSSLNIMYNLISHAYSFGVLNSTPWCKLDKVKWLCPVPGYDRHFAITESFNIEMINIPLNDDGPDMDLVEKLVKEDDSIKGMWCVPVYANPSGISYSNEVVKRLANLKPKAKDFRIYWDNAYCIHHLDDINQDEIISLLDEAERCNNPNIAYHFASTSKISFPGSGIAALALNHDDYDEITKYMSITTIGYDKINQLRHVRYFKDLEGLKKQIHKHALILKPKFDEIESIFSKNLNGLKDINWSKPHGGYFISLEVKGIAKEVVERCKQCGVLLTPAGSAFPCHNDPNNSNIRIAPSYPSLEEIKKAMEVLCISIQIEYLKKKSNN